MSEVATGKPERTEVEWQEHWQTWAINRGYYGVYDSDVDLDRTCWSVEWCKTQAEAQAIAKRALEIDAIVRDQVEADPRGNRRVRLRVERKPDGDYVVGEYDYRRWAVTLRGK